MNFKQKIFILTILSSLFMSCKFSESSTAITYSSKKTNIPNQFFCAADDLSGYLCADISFNNVQNAVFTWYCIPKDTNTKILIKTNTVDVTGLTEYKDSLVSPVCKEGLYYCEVELINGTNSKTFQTDKKPVKLIFYEPTLPVLSVQTNNGKDVISKEDQLLGILSLLESDGTRTIYNNIKIKCRGNTTFTKAKKPYTIKLDSNVPILGLNSGKNYVLLANYMDLSFLKNEAAFYLSRQLGLGFTPHGQFVNLVINGDYKGLYWFGESIKVNKNRVDIKDKKDFLIELDDYFDEVYKFKSSLKNFPYQIKNDDEMNAERLKEIRTKINLIEDDLYNNNSIQYFDIPSFAKFYLINEIMDNQEIISPKSVYYTYKKDTGILSAGPVWDFDWGASSSRKSLGLTNCLYYDALFTHSEFINELNSILSSSLLDMNDFETYIITQKNLIQKSVELDIKRWGYADRNPVGKPLNGFESYVQDLIYCIKERTEYLKSLSF